MNPSRVPARPILLLALLVACTELSVEAVDVARVVVQPEDAALRVGASLMLSAEPQDRNGNVLTGRPIIWTSGNEGVATVDGEGRVTGVGPGTATVRAFSEGRSGEAVVAVSEGAVASVQIRPRQPVILVGGAIQLTADVLDSSGSPVATGIQWSTSDPGVATVAAGLVTGVATGAAWVRAVAGGVRDSTLATVVRLSSGSVTVSPASALLDEGDTLRFGAAVIGGNGLPVPSPVVAWSSSNAGVASVDGAGLVTARDSGEVTIRADHQGQSGSATVRVRLRQVASVTVTPAVVGLAAGGTIQLTAVARDGQGTPLPNRAVAWTSANPQVASVDATGRLSAHSTGSTQITATIGGVVGTAHVAVTAVSVASVDVTPTTGQLAVDDTLRLTAVARDGTGAPLTGRAVTWTSSDPAIATVDNAGLVHALAGGSVTITATVSGVSGTAQIGVTSVPVAVVDVAPASGQLAPGETLQLTATARDAAGAILPGRPVTWSTSDAAVATVDASGLVRAVAGGSVTIRARIGGVDGTASITVRVPVASVTVAPATAQIESGATVQLAATPRDASGNALSGRPVTWNTSDASVATVSSGLVTGVNAGTATITATSEGQSGTSVITVLPKVSRIDVTPAFTNGRVGGTLDLTAAVYGQSGALLQGYPVVWSSSAPALATVDQQGRVSLHALGTVVITGSAGGKSDTSSIVIWP